MQPACRLAPAGPTADSLRIVGGCMKEWEKFKIHGDVGDVPSLHSLVGVSVWQ